MSNNAVPVLTGEGERLIAEHLGINLQDLKRAKIEREEAEALEKQRARDQREREEEARKKEARHKLFGDYVRWGMIRAWRSDKADTLVEVNTADALVCPFCGERPEQLQQLIHATGDILTGINIHAVKTWNDRSMGPGAFIKTVPAFRVKLPCKCGKESIYAAVYLPVEGV